MFRALLLWRELLDYSQQPGETTVLTRDEADPANDGVAAYRAPVSWPDEESSAEYDDLITHQRV